MSLDGRYIVIENNVPRYQSKRVLWAYRVVDICLPYLILLCIQPLLSFNPWKDAYSWLGIFSGVFLFLCTQLLGGYSRFLERSIAKKLEIISKAWIASIVVLSFLAYINYSVFSFARAVILVWVVITPLSVFLLKFIINRISLSTSQGSLEVLVLGNGYSFNDFELAQLKRYNICLDTMFAYDIISIENIINSTSPDFVVLNLDETAEPALIKELTHLDLQGVHLLPLHRFMETFLRKCYIPYDSTDLAYLERISTYNRVNFLSKRVFDLFSAILLGIITTPVMIYAALKIRSESPGPIIFSQARVARGGNEKVIYKFRSMHVDAEKYGAQFASKDDPRAYEFGAFMRKTRIDELPQLWNVIKGDLHFVGPRPERKVFTDQLEEEIPYYNERHLVSPGITGWAQVLYPYGANTEDARQKLMYDLYYIKHWSIWLEIETLIRTVGVIIGKKGW